MNIKEIKKAYNFILILFLLFSLSVLFNNKTIEKEIKINNNGFKALDQEGQTYRLVTSADNVQVPVPKGYVASGVTGENYVTPEYQHTTITHKVSTTPTVITWSSPEGEQYPWTQDSNGIWISGNQGIPNSTSTLESEEFDYIKGTTLTINYTYSSQNGDFFDIDLINLTNNITTRILDKKYGNTSFSFDYTTSDFTYTMNDWATGRYKIRAIYSKDSSTDGGQDSGYIKTSTYYKEDVNGETLEEVQKTIIHNGGFVIYQLTDEELEIDPNGTSVIINDINKDEAQSTRNQYVWVPVTNINDISRTKNVNNGIMQFGQNYTFTSTSITIVTSVMEPRVVEEYDRTKYYLQRYLNNDDRTSYLNKMQEDYIRMVKSINKYKGFYIGRYETGDDYEHSTSKKCYTNPRVIRFNDNVYNVTWYDSYKELERLSGKTEEYVETRMLYDSLYDYTLKWLNDTGTRSYNDIAIDSGNWGKYCNSIMTVNSGNIWGARTGAVETITYKGETYSNYPTSSNNIFDIAGNSYEWTMSRYSTNCRKVRGGSLNYSSNNYPAFFTFNQRPNEYGWGATYGTRSELLIK